MTTAQWLGLVLAVWGAAGMWVAGKGRWAGWAMGLAVQPVWAAFALVVHSWPLLFSPLLYGTVYARNLWRWWHKPRQALAPEPRAVECRAWCDLARELGKCTTVCQLHRWRIVDKALATR